MKIDVVVSNYMGNNTICLSNEGKVIVVDPSFNKEGIEAAIDGKELIAIAITHGHFDHFVSLDYFVDKYQVPVYAHKNEFANMKNPDVHLGTYYGIGNIRAKELVPVEHGELVDFGHGMKLRAIRVEGHTSDSICYYSEDDKFLLSGDTIFYGSIGRVDFYKNDMALFTKNIKENLLVLPDDTVIYSGHGPVTSIGQEKGRAFYNGYSI